MAKKRPAASMPQVFLRRRSPSPQDFLAKLPPSQRRLVEATRRLIFAAAPRCDERVKAGWNLLGYHSPHYFCFLFPRGNQVFLGFEWGARLEDPLGILEGEGAQVRYVALGGERKIPDAALKQYIKAAASPLVKGTASKRKGRGAVRPKGRQATARASAKSPPP